jgi:hypothetical protein
MRLLTVSSRFRGVSTALLLLESLFLLWEPSPTLWCITILYVCSFLWLFVCLCVEKRLVVSQHYICSQSTLNSHFLISYTHSSNAYTHKSNQHLTRHFRKGSKVRCCLLMCSSMSPDRSSVVTMLWYQFLTPPRFERELNKIFSFESQISSSISY